MSGYDKIKQITVFTIPNLYFQKIYIPYRVHMVDTWRKWIQQFLHTKYNFPVRFLLVNTLFSITWVVAEKGKGDKSLVPRNENLKKKKCF